MFASGIRAGAGTGLTLADLDWQNSVLEIANNTAAPPTEVSGDRYLLDATGGGVHANWDGAAVNDVVQFNGSVWEVTYAAAGDEGGAAWVEDLDTNYIWDGSTWAAFGSTVSHNNTLGLQGGTTDEYYHLTAAQRAAAVRDATNVQNGLMPTGKLTNWDAAFSHVSADGSSHSKVNANETAAGLNTTHRTGSGSDHADVALNTTHRGLTSGNPHNVLPSELLMARISGSTYSTVQHMQDVFHSAGWVSGGVVTDDTDGTISVAQGTGLIRATNTAVAQILFCDWAQESGVNVNVADNDISYVYVEYNGGSPRVIATTTKRTDFNTNILLATVSREGTELHINQTDQHTVGDHANSMIRRLKGVQPYGHVSGGILSETGTRNIALTAGEFWRGLTQFNTSAVDTSGAPTFNYYYNNGSWQKVAGVSDIHQTNYNDFGTGLATLSNNKYGVHWVYLEADSDAVSVVYGIGDYTLFQAENAQPPASVPQHLEVEGILAGKIIIKKSDAAFTQTESAFQTKFTGSVATEHNDTSGLQGGAATEYYHMTSAQHTAATRDATNGQNGLMPTGKLTGWDAAATHVSNDGSSHSKVTANETAAGLNTTHRTSDGSDHSKVTANETAIGLNTTHRSSDGKNHADVVLNNSHRAGNGTDHSFINQNVTSTGSPLFAALSLTADLTIANGGTGQSTAQLAMNALSAVAGGTNEHVLTKDTGTGNAVWKVAAVNTDEKVKIDAAAAAGYIGIAAGDGVLRTGAGLTYVDGGDYVTLAVSGTFVDRGDPASDDFTTLTTDGTWTTMDLSSIIPAGAKAVLLFIYIVDDATGSTLTFRKLGNTNAKVVSAHVTKIANVEFISDGIIALDGDRKIEYQATNTTWTNTIVTVKGWWI